jgi:hypothetical protein
MLLTFSGLLNAADEDTGLSKQLLDKPLIERYVLDELKDLRIENMKLKNEVERRISKAEVEQTDRAARYMTDTIGNVFYLIAAATSILIFAGWNSLRDIRSKYLIIKIKYIIPSISIRSGCVQIWRQIRSQE